jgi:hypothetical protein
MRPHENGALIVVKFVPSTLLLTANQASDASDAHVSSSQVPRACNGLLP